MTKRGQYRAQRSKRQRITPISRAERKEHAENRKQAAIYARERDEALLTMNRAVIAAFWLKYSVKIAPAVLQSDVLFEVTIRRMIVKAKSLPLEFRRESFNWLKENGLKADDRDF